MVKHLFVLILVVLTFIALIIILMIRNHKDKKDLFKKLPGDYADPKEVESEFDTKV
jgi:cytochrome c-type biogenesis protein CcmE